MAESVDEQRVSPSDRNLTVASKRRATLGVDQLRQLQAALLNAFKLDDIEQIAQVYLHRPLSQIVPVRDRTLTDIVFRLVEWAADTPEVGVQGLLDAALQCNPRNPDLNALKEAWREIEFVFEPQCPYPGMKPFGKDDSKRFFGRNSEIEEAVQRLRLEQMLVAIGASGVGKSSLVLAGIVPAMEESSFFGRNNLTVHIVRPGAMPMAALAEALSCPEETPLAMLECARMAAAESPTLLVVDQFEEVFTLSTPEQASAVELVVRQIADISSFYVLITVRADFYPELLESSLWDKIQRHRLEIVPLRGAALRAAIAEPAEKEGVTVEDALIERLQSDTAREPGALPFLQETLLLLWEHIEGRRLTLRAYDQVAGGDAGRSALQVAMARQAEHTYGRFSPPEQNLARRTLLDLVHFGAGRPDTRRQQTETQLRVADDDGVLFDSVLAQLIDNRLLTASSIDAEPQRRIDIAHEALLTGWPRLRQWINEDRIDQLVHRRIGDAADEWQKGDCDSSYLYRGAVLSEAERWSKQNSSLLDELETDFLRQSRKQRWWSRATWTGMVVAGLLLLVLAGLAFTGVLNRLIYRPLSTPWSHIPSGAFTMGSTSESTSSANLIEPKDIGDRLYVLEHELPAHTVHLSEFAIMRYEVTRAEYEQCYRAGVCSRSSTVETPADDAGMYPVTGVNWAQAQTYCQWIDADLPTEAQWEKAARGNTSAPIFYPWGNQFDESRANIKTGKLMPVGAFSPAGDSFYGAADLAGNAWEWVRDYYQSDYYANSPRNDPQGPEGGEWHVMRGGSYDNDWVQARITFRQNSLRPVDSAPDVGFRCAKH